MPFIGHMGICTSAGVIRDFAGPYFVSVSILHAMFPITQVIAGWQCMLLASIDCLNMLELATVLGAR